LAFGAVLPLLYYIIIILPDAIWIGLLFAVDALGRILGGALIERLQNHLGTKPSLILTQAIMILSYVLLCAIGHFQITHTAAITVVYVSRFIGSFATTGFPSAGSLFQRISPRFTAPRAGLLTMIGFIAGCALAMPGNGQRVLISIFETGGLTRAAEFAALISCIALLIACWMPTIGEESGSADGPACAFNSTPGLALTLLCEAAFGMTLCVLPLMARKTYFFTPTNIAMLLGGAALVSQTVRGLARRVSETPGTLMLTNLGILCAGLGFAGFVTALKLSWVSSWHSHPMDGMKIGYWLVWISSLPAAIGHGLLRASLPSILIKSGETPRHPQAVLRFDQLCAMICGVSALLAAAMWLGHERSSFAIPGLLTALALPLGAYSSVIAPKPVRSESMTR